MHKLQDRDFARLIALAREGHRDEPRSLTTILSLLLYGNYMCPIKWTGKFLDSPVLWTILCPIRWTGFRFGWQREAFARDVSPVVFYKNPSSESRQ